MTKPRVIAFYLPQYHPTSTNNKWWGKGFTEWTNVGKAKPLFYGHEQPKVPADLGYYDLRLPEVREAQAELAREAGIEGFCYYHYWFGDGHEELEMPFKEVVKSGKPDFPFCLCWANESWHKKFWNIDGTCEKETIAEQHYDDEIGNEKHFYSLLSSFKDKRYIRVENKLLFVIYKPLDMPSIKNFIQLWNSLAEKNGLGGFYFVGHTSSPDSEATNIIEKGLDGVISVRINNCTALKYNKITFTGVINQIFKRLLNIPFVINYKDCVDSLSYKDPDIRIIPTIVPNWDHTPRSGRGGIVFRKSTPLLFRSHVISLFNKLNDKNSNGIVFLKSWNEWGEGNYMEPDLLHGKAYINALREVLEKYKD